MLGIGVAGVAGSNTCAAGGYQAATAAATTGGVPAGAVGALCCGAAHAYLGGIVQRVADVPNNCG